MIAVFLILIFLISSGKARGYFSQQHDELGSLLEAGQVDVPSAPLGPNLDITDLEAHEFGRPADGDVDDDGVRPATATE